MRLMTSALVIAFAAPTLAFAGPAGTGLTHTEEVARKRAAATAFAPLHLKAASACHSEAEAALTAHAKVKSVSRAGETLVVKVRTSDTDAAPSLQRIVDDACGRNVSTS